MLNELKLLTVVYRRRGKDTKKPANNRPEQQKPVPMDIGNVQLRKLTREERETCMKEGVVSAAAKRDTWPRTAQKARGTEYDNSTENTP